MLAADVTDSDGEKKISVYLKRQPGKQMAKKLGVSKINEFASTEEASYFKETSKKTTSVSYTHLTLPTICSV